MKLKIRESALSGHEELRTLLLDAANELAGENSKILEASLPWDGAPLLLVDSNHQPVLVSFEVENSRAALLNGLMAIEQLSAALPWLNRIHAHLEQKQLPPRLVIVSPEPPPGASIVLTACHDFALFTYSALNVNGDTGLWLKPVEPPAQAALPPLPVSAAPAVRTDAVGLSEHSQLFSLPSLSQEEAGYFQQL
jgi:hypothetical protein